MPRAMGRRLQLALKSGNFGGRDFFTEAFDARSMTEDDDPRRCW